VWAAGVQASALTGTLAEQTGASLDRAGRIGVNADLTLPGHPEVFVVGDMISLDHLPGVAQVAIQGAKYAAKEIDRRLKGKQPQGPFRYFDKGDMATIARFKAIARVRNLRLTGLVAWLAWLAVHLFYLTGFKNRVTALLHWFVTFASNDRSERTATEQQIFARLALERVGPEEFISSPHAQHPDRDELEQIAAEEARLTDEGVRGRAATSPAG
jgi:NADH dehydrogenase